MSETYIITAKTVDEAIAIANREYADADHEVAYDIIDMPKKGFFGIGARDAKIKITVSKVQKVDLGSLVDDIRSMKTLTDRGGSRTPEKKTKPAVHVTAKNVQKSGAKPAQKTAQTQNGAKPQTAQKTEKPLGRILKREERRHYHARRADVYEYDGNCRQMIRGSLAHLRYDIAGDDI